ncbi:MAG TPA: UDP-4-amino-4,6-dideoxy-N-acetyl-beta-L-altrosamine N-acetyltransferase [Lachnospiraceae bacterium]|nr:UDP-4-amino-4,6-dideoxy-N-acetyl-beta-L-altrosamine N-acetyltransferase [Lachnospiraceae bacterium]
MLEDNYDVCIRPITMDDTNNIVRWRNSAEVKKYFIYQKDFTIEGHTNWMLNKVATGQVVQFIIVENQTGMDIGSVYLQDIDYVHKKAEYGIFIGEDSAKGKGYGTQVAKLMIKYAFKELGLHRLYLRAFADNRRAISSYQKAGFISEGLLKDDVFVNGQYRDIEWMGIIDQE